AIITCKCGSNFTLTKPNNKFQLSNFYKHIKSLMKEFVAKNDKQKRTSAQASLSLTSSVQSQPLVQIITNLVAASPSSTSSTSTIAPTKNNSAPASSVPARSSKRRKL
ncbi:unnamed protein product, partial [Didymodactylos carnosus]